MGHYSKIGLIPLETFADSLMTSSGKIDLSKGYISPPKKLSIQYLTRTALLQRVLELHSQLSLSQALKEE
jgi:hypothetical protein